MSTVERKGILKRLAEGPVVGDGGCIFEMERRGYATAGPWTPEVTVEHPEALRQLHREHLRAGADVIQTLTFYANEYKISKRCSHLNVTASMINEAACDLAREVANEGGALVAASISQTLSYGEGKGKDFVQSEFRQQVDNFLKKDIDFFIVEFFNHIEEIEWAIEVVKTAGFPLAATMAIGPMGTKRGETPGECAVRMVRAGADIVGVNCRFGPDQALQTMAMMKEALDKEGLKPYLMAQPICYWTLDAKDTDGHIGLQEYPFAMERRQCSRWDIQKFARKAYELGVHYIGLCCGAEAYHVRAVAEELAPERGGRKPEGSEKHGDWGSANFSDISNTENRRQREFWENMNPGDGRG